MTDRLLCLPANHTFFLFGPRLTGKSTLLKSVFRSNTIYIDLLKSSEYLRYAADPALFRREVMALPPDITHVVVDEIQRLPLLLDDVHSVLESERPRVFCLSGSSARKLKRAQANLLGGRAWTFNLFPLTHRELGNEFSLDKALRIGTLPPVYLGSSDRDALRTLRAYVDTYLKEELQAEAEIRNVGTFIRFLSIAADHSGQQVNYSSISHDTGATMNQVREFFRILEDTLIGVFLPPYAGPAGSITRRLVKHPKFLFFDTGVWRALQGKAGVPLERGSTEYGRAFEQFVILEMMRLAAYREKEYRFSFYRTAAGAEADLVIETPAAEVFAVEVKSGDNPAPSSLRGLQSFKEVVPQAHLFCASTAPRRQDTGGVAVIPWQDLPGLIGLD
jgi:uncharacterized protein